MTKVSPKDSLRKNQKPAAGNWLDKILERPYQTIFLICILLYVQILSFGLVHFDDHGFVLMAADTLQLSNIPAFFKHSVFWVLGDTTQDTDVFYRPLQNVLYAICNTIASEKAWIYHFFGLILHAATACVLFRFFKELKYHASVALIFALIYAVHPVLVQGVAWIAGIGDQMAALFVLLSAIYFFRYISSEQKGIRDLALHLLFFVCALFSKEVSIALIPLFIFWFFLINQKVSNKKSLLIASAGWICLSTLYFVCRSNAIHPAKVNLLVSAFESFKVNGPLLFEYFEKMFLPYRLSPIPSREDAQLVVGLIVLAGIIFLLAFRKRFTRMALFGAVWFAAFLFPSFIQQNPEAHFFVFEHRLYLPLIGIIIIMMEAFNIAKVNVNSAYQKYGFAVVLLVFVALTFSHSRTFSDPYTFYDKAISSSPQSVIAYNGYGKLLLEDKKYAEAIEAFKKSHEYKPDDLETTGKIAEVYLKNLNNPQEAILWFKKTLVIAPNSIEAAVSIGDAYFIFLKDTGNAVAAYENALKVEPNNPFALANLGLIHTSKGRNEIGRTYLHRSLESDPKNLTALKWMAISYFNEGKISESVKYLNDAYAYYPEDIDLQRNLMICYYKLHDKERTGKFTGLLSKKNQEIPLEIIQYLSGK